MTKKIEREIPEQNAADAVDRVLRLIHALADKDTPPELYNELVDWFRSEVSDEEKQEAFVRYYTNLVPRTAEPSEELRRSFNRLASRLGLPLDEVLAPVCEELVVAGKRKRSLVRIGLRVAAISIPFFVLLGMYWGSRHAVDTPAPLVLAEAIHEAYEGVQKEVELPDNSVVWINSGSHVRHVESVGDERHVYLEGEAYFDVTHDEERPFVVHTPKLDVVVLGTEFNVHAYPDREVTEVLLTRGLVKVIAGERSAMLNPGEKLTYDHRTAEFTVESCLHNDWRSDVIHAKERTLAELFRMIGNYYNKEIVFDDAHFNQSERIQIWFGKHRTPEEVLRILSRIGGGFEYDMEGDRITIKKSVD